MDPKGALQQVSEKTGKTPAQVALNWCLAQDGVVAIPKASTVEHIAENCGASGWRLSAEHIEQLARDVSYERRGPVEMALRRSARYLFQRFGLEPA
jgi:diketogulonate reductase-like aldo/keto reductase